MSLGQVAEATNVHLDTKAAPHRIHLELMLKLPLMRNFKQKTEAEVSQPTYVTQAEQG